VPERDLAGVMGWHDDPTRAVLVAQTLVRDGLAVRTADGFELP
jgi:hypothetical protein